MQLRFDTTPTAVETVSLYGWLAGTYLSSNSDEPEIGTGDQMIIVYKALRRYALTESQAELVQYAQENYNEKYRELLGAQADEMDDWVEPLA